MIYINDLEAIMGRVEVLLRRTTGIEPFGDVQTVTRIWQPWDEIASIAQPAIVIVEPSQDMTNNRGQQISVRLNLQLVCYIQVDPKDLVNPPNTRVNNFVMAVQRALLPYTGKDKAVNAQTLDGLVSNVFIDGKILKDAGIIDGQGSALIPVTVLIS